MIRQVCIALSFSLLLFSNALAQNCSVPNNLANGTNADATQVMANFNAILTCLNNQAAPRGYLSGLTLGAPGGNPAFTVAAGVATSDDATTLMNLSASLSKTTGPWMVGSGNGALDTGTTVANSTWYHVFEIERVDVPNVNVDILISQSATSPSLPTNYTKKRRIGSMKTDTSGNWLAFKQYGDQFVWASVINEINTGSPASTLTPLSLGGVPSNIATTACIRGLFSHPTAGNSVLVAAGDETVGLDGDSTARNRTVEIATANLAMAFQLNVPTNSNNQIKYQANAGAAALNIQTWGYIDTRGRFN